MDSALKLWTILFSGIFEFAIPYVFVFGKYLWISENISDFHEYLDIENELSTKIGLKTKILFNKEKKNGSLTIKFKNLDQLEYIIKKFN